MSDKRLGDIIKNGNARTTINWLTWIPTPYNAVLFRELAFQECVELKVHYRVPMISSHPWESDFINSYSSRCYKHFMGIDWTLVKLAAFDKDSFFVVGGWDHPTAIFVICIRCFLKYKIALWTDTPNPDRKRRKIFSVLRRFWLAWVFRNVNAIMGTGEPALTTLYQMGAAKEKLVNLPYWIDLDLYKFAEKESLDHLETAHFRFISVGRLINRLKGHDIAIRSLKLAFSNSSHSFDYYLAGTGEDEDLLRELSANLGIEENVKFLGWLEPRELASYLSQSHFLIHPSPLHEPYGVAVLEGMAAGCVVMASDKTCAALDRIHNGENGFIHYANDITCLSDQIKSLIINPKKIREIGLRARKTAELWPVKRGIQIVTGILNKSQTA
ncbi:MAG: glycosyltransferase family 4 protein [Syntrophaceae bacterium]|nr:glycosyltransferase family 4 protein [Syntrophaceae bacterium]